MKEQYDTAQADVKKAEEETQFNFTKKKGIAAEKKEARVEKEEAEKYQKLSQQMVGDWLIMATVAMVTGQTQCIEFLLFWWECDF